MKSPGRTSGEKPDESGRMRRSGVLSDKHCLQIQSFRADKKRILVFSEAGGTAELSRRSQDQNTRQRFITLCPMEGRCVRPGFGRTHRSNEASQPHYRLVTTNLK